MLFARHSRACRRLTEQFAGRTVQKIYWAAVDGTVVPPAGNWTDYVRKIPGEARAEIVDADHPEGKKAVLEYRTVGRTRFGAWLEIRLLTGRTHQIRIQAAARGSSVIGDELYGSVQLFGPPQDDRRLRNIALHARSVTFCHPMTWSEVSVTAPLPDPWGELHLDDSGRGAARSD